MMYFVNIVHFCFIRYKDTILIGFSSRQSTFRLKKFKVFCVPFCIVFLILKNAGFCIFQKQSVIQVDIKIIFLSDFDSQKCKKTCYDSVQFRLAVKADFRNKMRQLL